MVRRSVSILSGVLLASLAGGLHGQDEEKKIGWFDTAELSLVATGGNTEANTFSFKNALLRTFNAADLLLEAGALRAETTSFTRRVIGPSSTDFDLVEETQTELTAESLYLRGKFSQEISDLQSWFAGLGWERNEFAGIANRSSLGGGVRQRWFDNKGSKLSTEYGLFLTREGTVVAGSDEDFLALRLSWDYLRQLTKTTTFGSVLAIDENLDVTSDFRVDTTNLIAVSITDTLALKLSVQLLFDNEPAFELVEREFPEGVLSGDLVAVELDTLDSVVTIALVVSF